MPDFNTKMHQNRFRLGLCPRPSLQRSPDPLAGFKEPTSEGRGREGRGRSTCLPPRFDNPGYGPDNNHRQQQFYQTINRWRALLNCYISTTRLTRSFRCIHTCPGWAASQGRASENSTTPSDIRRSRISTTTLHVRQTDWLSDLFIRFVLLEITRR